MTTPKTPPTSGPAELQREPSGQPAIIMLGLTIGLIMMGIQLWLLTIAFDLYRSGDRMQTVVVAIFSGIVFLGGLLMLRVLDRGPRRNR